MADEKASGAVADGQERRQLPVRVREGARAGRGDVGAEGFGSEQTQSCAGRATVLEDRHTMWLFRHLKNIVGECCEYMMRVASLKNRGGTNFQTI